MLIYKNVDKELKKLMSDEKFMRDSELSEITKLFTFHISRIIISELTNKGNPLEIDLNNEKIIDQIDSETVKKSILVLKGIIDEYKKTNLYSIDNISKQTEFSRYITKKLNEKFKTK